MEKFLIVEATEAGPRRFLFKSLEEMTSTLMALFRGGCHGPTATAWKKQRGQWVPMFPYQHEGVAV